MDITFEGPVWHLRGPAPYHFVTVPEAESELIAAASELVTYGWGMIPVTGVVGDTSFTTSLWPKNGGYIVPLKDAVRRAESIAIDDVVRVTLTIGV